MATESKDLEQKYIDYLLHSTFGRSSATGFSLLNDEFKKYPEAPAAVATQYGEYSEDEYEEDDEEAPEEETVATEEASEEEQTEEDSIETPWYELPGAEAEDELHRDIDGNYFNHCDAYYMKVAAAGFPFGGDREPDAWMRDILD